MKGFFLGGRKAALLKWGFRMLLSHANIIVFRRFYVYRDHYPFRKTCPDLGWCEEC